MKRSVLLLAALFAVFSVQADNRPQAVLKQLTAALGALEGYSVVFEVHTDGDVVPGYYEVSGDNYYMHVNGQEVYGDAEFRYEIDPDRKGWLSTVWISRPIICSIIPPGRSISSTANMPPRF